MCPYSSECSYLFKHFLAFFFSCFNSNFWCLKIIIIHSVSLDPSVLTACLHLRTLCMHFHVHHTLPHTLSRNRSLTQAATRTITGATGEPGDSCQLIAGKSFCAACVQGPSLKSIHQCFSLHRALLQGAPCTPHLTFPLLWAPSLCRPGRRE